MDDLVYLIDEAVPLQSRQAARAYVSAEPLQVASYHRDGRDTYVFHESYVRELPWVGMPTRDQRITGGSLILDVAACADGGNMYALRVLSSVDGIVTAEELLPEEIEAIPADVGTTCRGLLDSPKYWNDFTTPHPLDTNGQPLDLENITASAYDIEEEDDGFVNNARSDDGEHVYRMRGRINPESRSSVGSLL